MLDTMPMPLAELQHWPQRDAYLWYLHLSAQAFRFTDQLDSAVDTAELALDVADPNSEFATGSTWKPDLPYGPRPGSNVTLR